jgi:hypothetical protein
MALYTVLCFIKFDLINNGFGIIQKMMLLRMDNNRGKSDAHTSSKDNKIVEVLKIGMSQLEDVIIKTPVIETVVFVNKEKVQLPLVQDIAVSDDVDCPVVIEEV